MFIFLLVESGQNPGVLTQCTQEFVPYFSEVSLRDWLSYVTVIVKLSVRFTYVSPNMWKYVRARKI